VCQSSASPRQHSNNRQLRDLNCVFQVQTTAHRNGTARASLRWGLLFLSAGEESLAALIARTGRKANAGQEVRLADFDADAGVGLGAFETLNGCASPAALSLALKDAATRHHGAVGVVWLRAIVQDRDKLADIITGGVRQFVAENTPPDAAGQVLRVAQRMRRIRPESGHAVSAGAGLDRARQRRPTDTKTPLAWHRHGAGVRLQEQVGRRRMRLDFSTLMQAAVNMRGQVGTTGTPAMTQVSVSTSKRRRFREPQEDHQASTTRGKTPTIVSPGDADSACPHSRWLHFSFCSVPRVNSWQWS
jgi:hypothetical protein